MASACSEFAVEDGCVGRLNSIGHNGDDKRTPPVDSGRPRLRRGAVVGNHHGIEWQVTCQRVGDGHCGQVTDIAEKYNVVVVSLVPAFECAAPLVAKPETLPRDVYRRRDAVLALSEAKDIFAEDKPIEAREAPA